jgi:hypothetical protein
VTAHLIGALKVFSFVAEMSNAASPTKAHIPMVENVTSLKIRSDSTTAVTAKRMPWRVGEKGRGIPGDV